MSREKPRQQRTMRRSAGSLDLLQRELWFACRKMGDLIENDDPNIQIRAANALGQVSTAYKALYEATELEARMKEVEKLIGIREREPESTASKG